jgi:hypothetical protein
MIMQICQCFFKHNEMQTRDWSEARWRTELDSNLSFSAAIVAASALTNCVCGNSAQRRPNPPMPEPSEPLNASVKGGGGVATYAGFKSARQFKCWEYINRYF